MVRNTAGLLISVYNNIGTVLVTPLLQTCAVRPKIWDRRTLYFMMQQANYHCLLYVQVTTSTVSTLVEAGSTAKN